MIDFFRGLLASNPQTLGKNVVQRRPQTVSNPLSTDYSNDKVYFRRRRAFVEEAFEVVSLFSLFTRLFI